MEHIIIAIRDRKVGAYSNMAIVRAPGEAMRNFQDAVNDQNNRQLYNHADDFELYRIGTWDDQTGQITPEEPKQMAAGGQMKISQGITLTR